MPSARESRPPGGGQVIVSEAKGDTNVGLVLSLADPTVDKPPMRPSHEDELCQWIKKLSLLRNKGEGLVSVPCGQLGSIHWGHVPPEVRRSGLYGTPLAAKSPAEYAYLWEALVLSQHLFLVE